MSRSLGLFRIFGLVVIVALASILFFVADTHERSVALNTLLLGVLTCIAALPVAIFAAIVSLKSGLIPSLLWATLVCLAFIPTFMHVSAWDSAFGKLGWLTNLGGMQHDALRWFSAVWIHATAAVPQTALLIWFALHRSGKSYEEHALLDADRGSVFWRITLPRLLPVLAFCVLWILVGCSREIAVTDIYRIGTFAELIYLGYALGDFVGADGPTLLPINEFSTVVLLSIAVLAAALAWTLFEYLSQLKQSDEDASRRAVRPTTTHSAIGLVVILVLAVAPIGNLIVRGCKKAELIQGEPLITYSAQNLSRVIAKVPTEFQSEFAWSATIASLSAAVSMLVAILLVWLARESRQCRWIVVVAFSICIALPGPLIGSIILNAREWSDAPWYVWLFDRTIAAPLVANVVFCLPLACAMAWIATVSVSNDALESARLEGAGSISRLIRIVIAGNVSTLAGLLFLLFAFCFGELSASQLAIPPGVDTIPRRMLGLLHSGVNDVTAGLTLFLSLCILVFCAIGYGLASWNRHR